MLGFSQGEADGVSTSGDAGVFIPYLYLFCISKSKIGVESGLTGVVCSD